MLGLIEFQLLLHSCYYHYYCYLNLEMFSDSYLNPKLSSKSYLGPEISSNLRSGLTVDLNQLNCSHLQVLNMLTDKTN